MKRYNHLQNLVQLCHADHIVLGACKVTGTVPDTNGSQPLSLTLGMLKNNLAIIFRLWLVKLSRKKRVRESPICETGLSTGDLYWCQKRGEGLRYVCGWHSRMARGLWR